MYSRKSGCQNQSPSLPTYLSTASLKLSDESNVVALVLGVDVALLENQAHHGSVCLDASGGRVLLTPQETWKTKTNEKKTASVQNEGSSKVKMVGEGGSKEP